MRRLKTGLVLLLTGLTVAAAALAPQQLSALRDRQLSGAVHTETLDGDNNFSVWFPTLTERIGLLADFEAGSDGISSAYQQLMGDSLREAEQTALDQLAALEEDGILPPGTVPEQLSSSYGELLLLWTPENLGGASFYRLSLEDTGRSWNVSLALDAESGTIIRMELGWPLLRKYLDDPWELGVQFLEHQGLEFSAYSVGDWAATFVLYDSDDFYQVAREGIYLYILPVSLPEGKTEDWDMVPGPNYEYDGNVAANVR